jgi:hypothetical protein
MLDRFIDHSIPKAVRTVLWIITALYFLMWAVGQEFSALSWVLLTVSIAIRVPYWQAERKRKEEAAQRVRLLIEAEGRQAMEGETDMATQTAPVTPIKPQSGIALAGVPQDILQHCPPLVRNALAKMDVTHQDAFATEYNHNKKTVGGAYLRWLFGCHYFYLKQPNRAVPYLLTAGGFFCWMIADIFRMPGLVREFNRNLMVETCRNIGLIQ